MVETLKRRAFFITIAEKGVKWVSSDFIVQCISLKSLLRFHPKSKEACLYFEKKPLNVPLDILSPDLDGFSKGNAPLKNSSSHQDVNRTTVSVPRDYHPRFLFGFTATKRLGGAVQRNRAKRLLRACVQDSIQYFKPGYAYVFIARKHLLNQKSTHLLSNVQWCLKHVHRLLEP